MKAVRVIASVPLVYVCALGMWALLVLPSWMVMGPAGGPLARVLGPWVNVYLDAMGKPAGPVVAIAASLAGMGVLWRGSLKRDGNKGRRAKRG